MALACIIAATALAFRGQAVRQTPRLADLARTSLPPAPPTSSQRPPSEQTWVISSVATAIGGLINFGEPGTSDRRLQIKPGRPHVWSPDSYAPGIVAIIGPAGSRDVPVDHNVRAALVTLTADALVAENERVSAVLVERMRVADAHEAAAFLIGAFGLRESLDLFGDTRPALSRMASHLAMAQAVRGPALETLDGALARVIMCLLIGHERSGLAELDRLTPRLVAEPDRAWVRALRLRATGDWRGPLTQMPEALVERLELARAVRARLDSEGVIRWFPTIVRGDLLDWPRIALARSFAVQTGSRFAPDMADREIAEARRIWALVHGGAKAPDDFIQALNARPASSTVTRRTSGEDRVDALDWGMWASFSQRQLAFAITSHSRYLWMLGVPDEQAAFVRDVKARFSALALYPIVFRWIALNEEDYAAAVASAATLAASNPELFTASAWDFVATKPNWVRKTASFPFEETWFVEAVLTGTAYDVWYRSLRSGCRRPPTLEDLRAWAHERPFDHYTQWTAQWLPVAGTPAVENVQRAFEPIMDYDMNAAWKMLEYLPMNRAERLPVARRLCGITREMCQELALHHVREGESVEAARVYEEWLSAVGDGVRRAAGVEWLVRYYVRRGKVERAESLAREAGAVYSWDGLATYAQFLDSQGRTQEAEAVGQAIRERYDNPSLLGMLWVARGVKTGDRDLELRGWDLLRETFPSGAERLVTYALDAVPKDGVVFKTFGARAEAAGLRASDVVVGLDGWRVRSHGQFWFLARLRHDETMTFVVWRDGRYREIRAKAPERWLGVTTGTRGAAD